MTISSLQALRAIAAWGVVYHHYMQLFYHFKSNSLVGEIFSSYGNFGVDVFFLLSGFVMYISSSRPDITAWSFFIKRLFRVAPAYWFFTIILIFFSSIFEKEYSFTKLDFNSLIFSILFIPHENPSGIGIFPYLTVGWTLNLEMLFYSVLSLCILLNKRYVIYLCSIFMMLLPFLMEHEKSIKSIILNDNKVWQFLFGFLVAWLYLKCNLIKIRSIPLGISLLLIASFTLSKTTEYIFLQRTISATATIIGFLMLENIFNRKTPITLFITRLGDYSYSTYLCHILIIGLFLHFIGSDLNIIEESAVLFIMSVVIYITSFYSYEKIETSKLLSNLKIFLVRTLS